MLNNRRLAILYHWLFTDDLGITLGELISFLRKPKVDRIAARFITRKEGSEDGEYIKVTFAGIPDVLFWPREFESSALDQVCAETFDNRDWHYYEHKNTPVEEEDVIVDVGAAEGLFSLVALQKCRKAVIIEPNPRFFQALTRSFLRHIPHKAELHHVAVGNRTMNVSLNEKSISSTITESGTGDLQMTTLDNLLSRQKTVTYIKADVEGYEMSMLQGAAETIKRHMPKMAITCYHQMNDYREMVDYVKTLVPEYQYEVKGITQFSGKPVMVHFWTAKGQR